MVKKFLSTMASAAGGLALLSTAGLGVASALPDIAEPDIAPAVNSTCTYAQVVAALKAQYPKAAEQFNDSPEAQAWLHDLVDAPPSERIKMLRDQENSPEAQPFKGIVVPLANSCHNY